MTGVCVRAIHAVSTDNDDRSAFNLNFKRHGNSCRLLQAQLATSSLQNLQTAVDDPSVVVGVAGLLLRCTCWQARFLTVKRRKEAGRISNVAQH